MTHCQCRTIRPDYVRNKESPMFLRKVYLSIVKILRKISLKIASRSAIKIETVSGPCNTCFLYARALAVRNMSRGGEINQVWIMIMEKCL